MTRRQHYNPRKNLPHDCPTKAEHDAKVEATGRPWTQASWDLLGRKPKDVKRLDTDDAPI